MCFLPRKFMVQRIADLTGCKSEQFLLELAAKSDDELFQMYSKLVKKENEE